MTTPKAAKRTPIHLRFTLSSKLKVKSTSTAAALNDSEHLKSSQCLERPTYNEPPMVKACNKEKRRDRKV